MKNVITNTVCWNIELRGKMNVPLYISECKMLNVSDITVIPPRVRENVLGL